MLHAENVARGVKLRVSKSRGGEGVYNVLTLQKSRGKSSPRGGKGSPRGGGAKAPLPPPINSTLIMFCGKYENINYMIVAQDPVNNSILGLHLGRGMVSSVRMVSLVRMVS